MSLTTNYMDDIESEAILSNTENIDEENETNKANIGTTLHGLGWSMLAACIGHTLEWFDWALFALLADDIGANFFPSGDHLTEVLSTFAVFGCAFFMRPVGGSLLGYIGDKYGRVIALNISIYIMAICSLITGMLPSYEKIGISAPICLTILRLFQGLSVGGEGTGAMTYIIEICPKKQKAFYVSLLHLASCGGLFATLFVGILRYAFTPGQMVSWAWRIPFLFGSLLGVVGIWLRYGLKQSGEFLEKKVNGLTKSNPLRESFMRQKLNMFTIICHLTFPASIGYTVYVWLPSYVLTKEVNPIRNIYLINTVSSLVHKAVIVPIAIVIDKHFASDPSLFLIVFGILCMIYLLFMFYYLAVLNAMQMLFVQIGFSIIHGIYASGVGLWAILRLKDTVTRYSSYGFAQNTAVALYGGTAPFLATLVILKYSPFYIGMLLFVFGLVSISTNIIWYYIDLKNRKMYDALDEEDIYTDEEEMVDK